MAIAYRLLSKAFPTSASDWVWDYGAVGETPKLVLFWTAKYTDATFAASWVNGLMLAHGFTDGTHHACACIAAEHATGGNTDSYSRGSNTKDIMAIDETNGATLFAAHVSSFTTGGGGDGFTMAIDTPAPAAGSQYIVFALVIFGDIDAIVGQMSTGSEIGFHPDCGGLLSVPTVNDTSDTSAGWSNGWFQRYPVIQQACRWWNLRDNNGGAEPTPWWAYPSSDSLLIYSQRNGTLDAQWQVTGMTQGGITMSQVGGGDDPLFWAIRKNTPGPLDIGIRTMLLPNTVASNSVRGFRGLPSAMLGMFGKQITVNAVSTANAAQCFGMNVVDDQGSAGCLMIQANQTNARSLMENRFIDIEQVTAPIGRYAGDFTSFDAAGGFTWNCTNGGVATPYVNLLGFGSTGAKGQIRGAGLLRGAGRVR